MPAPVARTFFLLAPPPLGCCLLYRLRPDLALAAPCVHAPVRFPSPPFLITLGPGSRGVHSNRPLPAARRASPAPARGRGRRRRWRCRPRRWKGGAPPRSWCGQPAAAKQGRVSRAQLAPLRHSSKRAPTMTSSRAACTTRSDSLSSAEVGSSSSRICRQGGRPGGADEWADIAIPSEAGGQPRAAARRRRTRGARSTARAMASRCSWPPLSWEPPSPSRVAKPSGRAWMKSSAWAARAAAATASMLAPQPMAMLSRIDELQGGGGLPE